MLQARLRPGAGARRNCSTCGRAGRTTGASGTRYDVPHPNQGALQTLHEVTHHRRAGGRMSRAPQPAHPCPAARIERRQHWIAAASSALLHLAFLLLAMLASKVVVTPPQGSDADAGGRMAVDFIGVAPPPASTPALTPPASQRPAASPVQSTPVQVADDPVPPEAADDARPARPPAPAATPPAAAPAPWRRSHTWGRPPGMLQENLAPVNAGRARSAAIERGRGDQAVAAAEPSMEVGGYQVYYSLLSEARLRAWRDQGMTELFLPLPGTRQYMICPLETALRRESGPCRLLDPDSPELSDIGDAREAINMQQVYRQGELVWRGPGPYR